MRLHTYKIPLSSMPMGEKPKSFQLRRDRRLLTQIWFG
uniref:Uncharacterized protein n=1 Tax=Anguilla anguilla TaxID=7936 RepID=A0A0E9TNA5_ANGAN